LAWYDDFDVFNPADFKEGDAQDPWGGHEENLLCFSEAWEVPERDILPRKCPFLGDLQVIPAGNLPGCGKSVEGDRGTFSRAVVPLLSSFLQVKNIAF